MNTRQVTRKDKIAKIKETINEILQSEKNIDMERFLLEIMNNFDISDRTAREYLKVALFSFDIDFDKEMSRCYAEKAKLEHEEHLKRLNNGFYDKEVVL